MILKVGESTEMLEYVYKLICNPINRMGLRNSGLGKPHFQIKYASNLELTHAASAVR